MVDRFALSDCDYAHRGLWSDPGVPENSLAAFDAAAAGGFGIELDVRLSDDGVAVVFHDPVLDRMSAASGFVQHTSWDTLSQVTLADTDERIPSLEETLDCVNGRVPVLVELKTDGRDDGLLEEAVLGVLCTYSGPAAAMSFDLRAVGVLARWNTTLMTGLLVEPAGMTGRDAFEAKCRRLTEVGADYLSLWHEDVAGARDLAQDHAPIITWTVTDKTVCDQVRPHTDALIFEDLQFPLVRAHQAH